MLTYDEGSPRRHAHIIRLGRVECVEEPVHAFRLQTRAGILHGDKNAAGTVLLGFDQQFPRAVARFAQRGVFTGIGIMLALRLAMIQHEPAMTRNMPATKVQEFSKEVHSPKSKIQRCLADPVPEAGMRSG